MICINTPPKTTMELETVSFQVRNLLFRGASIFRWTMLVFGGVHLFMFLEIENFDSECLRLVETQKEWGIFYLYLFTHVHHFFWEGAPTKSAFFGKMINKNSEAKKGFWKQRRNSPSKKDGHEITWTQQVNSKIWPWNYIQQRTVFISTKKVSSVFSPQFTWKGHIFQWKKKIPKQFFYQLVFFCFRCPKKFSTFPGPGGERRQRGKGGREWQGAGWIFRWMTPKVQSVVRKRLICMSLCICMYKCCLSK